MPRFIQSDNKGPYQDRGTGVEFEGRVTCDTSCRWSSSEDLVTGAAADLTSTTSYFDTDAIETATLAAGKEGQIKIFTMNADSGDMEVTVTNTSWSGAEGTITFDTIGDGCILVYSNSVWNIVGNYGGAFA